MDEAKMMAQVIRNLLDAINGIHRNFLELEKRVDELSETVKYLREWKEDQAWKEDHSGTSS